MADSNAFGGRRETLRADWIRRISSLVSRHSVRRLTILETLIPVAGSSVFCRWIICLLPRLLFYFRRAALGRRYDHADIGATRGRTTML